MNKRMRKKREQKKKDATVLLQNNAEVMHELKIEKSVEEVEPEDKAEEPVEEVKKEDESEESVEEIKAEEKTEESVEEIKAEEKTEESVEEIKAEEKTGESVEEIRAEEKTEESVEEIEVEEKASESEKEAELDEKAEDSEKEEKKESGTSQDDNKSDGEVDKESDETAAATEVVPYVDSSVNKYMARKKVSRYILIAVAVMFALVYVGGVIYYSIFFRGKTYINGYDISGMKVAEVEETFQKEIDEYSLEINFKNGSESIGIGDADLTYTLSESIESLKKKQNPFLWFASIGKEDDFTVRFVASYNPEKLSDLVYAYEYMQDENMKPSVNAKVSMLDGEVTVIPDKTGTELDKEKVLEEIETALKDYIPLLSIEEKECYIPAEILADSEEILSGAQTAEDYLAMEATFDFDGYKVSISKEDLADMAYIDTNGKLKISETNVGVFARNFAEQYSTCYTKRKFKTHDGRNIEVYGGYYGWQLDPETETEELYQYLSRGKSFTKEPACIRKGYTYSAENDIGGNYVEIDLSGQHVYVFQKGQQVFDAPCVSGNMSLGRGTPGGLYGITYKARNVVLRGPDYESPVSYWMPFNGGIGLHDATWRGSFGGSIYWSNGSHGCVNLPYSAAATIFGYVEEGMPVVCYWN